MTTETQKRSFALGNLAITPGALERLNIEDVQTALCRHVECDWGECCQEDVAENDFALDKRLRILSVYHDRKGSEFWIITEADRFSTTVLLPEEY